MAYTHVKKPFPEFKWRWASYTPSESLNDPRVNLGVLRAMFHHEGDSPSAESFLETLKVVEEELSSSISLNLVRENQRNLLRNSQQYWSGLDLLASTSPTIQLTEFGRQVARGDITREEFAGSIVRTLTLPNVRIENDKVSQKWNDAGLLIQPLVLILSVICELGNEAPQMAFLSTQELVKVVIPLSSVKANVSEIVEHVFLFRDKSAIFNTYDDFAPDANDKRISREFLLFLHYHKFLRIRNPFEVNYLQEFFADAPALKLIKELLLLPPTYETVEVASLISHNTEIELLQRERRVVTITARPGQAKFRQAVLLHAGNKCLLTNETLSVVLRACHIIPVEFNGSDDVNNGLCLREDLHILFDSGHLRINEYGEVSWSALAMESEIYRALPKKITLPSYVSVANLAYRSRYIS